MAATPATLPPLAQVIAPYSSGMVAEIKKLAYAKPAETSPAATPMAAQVGSTRVEGNDLRATVSAYRARPLRSEECRAMDAGGRASSGACALTSPGGRAS